jgi:mannosyl-3-phosphoglycerate phosphatase
MKREYEETIVTQLDDIEIKELQGALRSSGLVLTRGGRFYSISAPTDKGRAVEALTMLFRRAYGYIRTVGIGDSWNDIPMLSSVDVAVLVQKPGKTWEDIDLEGLKRVDGVGPRGWTNAIEALLSGDESVLLSP